MFVRLFVVVYFFGYDEVRRFVLDFGDYFVVVGFQFGEFFKVIVFEFFDFGFLGEEGFQSFFLLFVEFEFFEFFLQVYQVRFVEI